MFNLGRFPTFMIKSWKDFEVQCENFHSMNKMFIWNNELSEKMLVNIWLLELNVGRSNIDLKVDNYTSLEKLQANLK